MKVDRPGIGGSLGECVLCGKSFALEVITGKSIATVHMDGFGYTALPLHGACLETLEGMKGQGWEKLPDGPLRREFEKSAKVSL